MIFTTARADQNRTVRKSIHFLDNFLGKYGLIDFAVRLWDGSFWNSSPAGNPRCTLVLNHPGALKKAFGSRTRFSFGEAYLNGDIEVEGDLRGAVAVADCLHGLEWSWRDKARFRRLPSIKPAGTASAKPRVGSGPSENPPESAKVSRHSLDPPRSEDFFRFFRQEGLTPNCAFFHDPKDAIENALSDMYDFTCEKLRLQEGIHLLDLNSGWGDLAFHAAKNFGVEVIGVGADPQAVETMEKAIHRAGLSYRCRLQKRPYDALQERESYDRIVCANLFERIDESRVPDLFAHAWNLLRPGGLFLFQSVVGGINGPSRDGESSLERLFPEETRQGSVADILRIAEWTGYELRDVENLREHCAITLQRWQEYVEKKAPRIRLMVNDSTYRGWRLFLAKAGYGFQSGRLNLHQILLYKPDGGQVAPSPLLSILA